MKAVKELKKSPTRFVRTSKWSMENSLLYYRGKIYVPRADLHCRILALCHDSKLAGHPGRWKTLELVSWNYWWPQMSRYIGKYVSVMISLFFHFYFTFRSSFHSIPFRPHFLFIPMSLLHEASLVSLIYDSQALRLTSFHLRHCLAQPSTAL